MLKLIQSRLTIQRSSMIYVLVMSIGSVANYLLYPLLQATLKTNEFSQIATTLAIFGQLSGVLLALNIISLVHGKKNKSIINSESPRKTIITVFFIMGFAFSVIYPVVGKHLDLIGVLPYILIMSLVVTSIPSMIIVGKLQSSELIIESSIYTLTASLGKLLLAFLMSRNYGLAGATWGIVIGQLLGMLSIIVIYRRRHYKKSPSEDEGPVNISYSQTIYIIFICTLIGVLQNADTVLGRYLLDESSQYNYIVVSSLSNVAYFSISMLAWIYLSKLKFNQSRYDYRAVFKSTLIMLLFTGIGVFISGIAGKKIIYMYSKIQIDEIQLIYNIAFQALLAVVGFFSYWLSASAAKKTLMILLIPTLLSLTVFVNSSETSGINIVATLLCLTAIQLILLVLLSLSIRNKHSEI